MGRSMRWTLQRQCQCDQINETETDEDMQQVSGRQEAPKTFCSENLNVADVLGDEETVWFFFTPYIWTLELLTFYYVRRILKIWRTKLWVGLNRKRVCSSGGNLVMNRSYIKVWFPVCFGSLMIHPRRWKPSFSVFNFPFPHKLASG
jgi:hypothetical protein